MISLRTLEKGLFLATLALVACNKDDDDSDTGLVDTDTGDDDPEYLEPYWFSIDAFFGYDAATNDIVAYNGTSSGGAFTQNPAILVAFMEEGNSPQAVGNDICTILVEQAGTLDAKTSFTAIDSSAHAVTLGFEIDWSQATITHDCDDLLDPAVWGEDLANIKTVQWGAGITTPVDTFLAAGIKEEVDGNSSAGDWATDWEPYLLGGRPFLSTTGTLWNTNGNSAANPKEFYYAFGNAIDPSSHTIITDGAGATSPLLVTDISDGTVPTGAYAVQTAYTLNFQTPLSEIFVLTPE